MQYNTIHGICQSKAPPWNKPHSFYCKTDYIQTRHTPSAILAVGAPRLDTLEQSYEIIFGLSRHQAQGTTLALLIPQDDILQMTPRPFEHLKPFNAAPILDCPVFGPHYPLPML